MHNFAHAPPPNAKKPPEDKSGGFAIQTSNHEADSARDHLSAQAHSMSQRSGPERETWKRAADATAMAALRGFVLERLDADIGSAEFIATCATITLRFADLVEVESWLDRLGGAV